MLLNEKSLHGYTIHATDGDMGHVDQFYFDDDTWTVRYIIVKTGKFFFGHKVLVSPISLEKLDLENKKLFVNLTMEQVKHSPDINTEKPISRQKEAEYLRYYNLPAYWGGIGLWGREMYPAALGALEGEGAAEGDSDTRDTHLRSTNEVRGYAIRCIDDECGHLEDFFIDTDTWTVRYLAVHHTKSHQNKKVLTVPKLVDRVLWAKATVFLNTSRQKLLEAPEYSDGAIIDAETEKDIYNHFLLHPYWENS
jgi:hypothetical protein